MKVTLWNTYKNYIEIINLEYGSLSNQVVQANKNKWDSSSDFTQAVSNDGVMSAYEKKQAKKEWDTLKLNYDSQQAQADYYWPTGVTQPAEKQSAIDAYTNLNTYLFVTPDSNGKALLATDNMDTVSTIVKLTYDNTFLAFYTAYTNLTKVIAQKAKDLADAAGQAVKDIAGNLVYDVKMFSTQGTIFKNGNIQTQLSAKVYHGDLDITDQVDASRFHWSRTSPNPASDTTWNASHGYGVKYLDITSLDVQMRAMFECDVNLDGLTV